MEQDLHRKVMNAALKAENDLLEGALTQHLGRRPQPEDYTQCSAVAIEGVMDRYTLQYRGVALGLVTKETDQWGMVTYRFTPRDLCPQ